MANLINTDYATETLLAQIDYEALTSPGIPQKVVNQFLQFLAIVPDEKAKGLAVMAELGLKAFEFFGSTNPVAGLEEVCTAVLTDLRSHGSEIAELRANLKTVLGWMSSYSGARVLAQAARAAENTADPKKVERIARLLNNGALSWPDDNEKEQIRLQQLSEFTRIAQILLDTDVLVLRAIYSSQQSLVATYRELVNAATEYADPALQDEWSQAVWQVWKTSQLSGPNGNPIRFLDLLSALPRLQSQGLISPIGSQVVQAEIASVPYGLTDLGAQFVETVLVPVAGKKPN